MISNRSATGRVWTGDHVKMRKFQLLFWSYFIRRALTCSAAKNVELQPSAYTVSWQWNRTGYSSMVRGITPVLCTTLLVTGDGRKPTTCALRNSGVNSLPCKRLDSGSDPLTSLPPNLVEPWSVASLSIAQPGLSPGGAKAHYVRGAALGG